MVGKMGGRVNVDSSPPEPRKGLSTPVRPEGLPGCGVPGPGLRVDVPGVALAEDPDAVLPNVGAHPLRHHGRRGRRPHQGPPAAARRHWPGAHQRRGLLATGTEFFRGSCSFPLCH